MKTNSKVEQIKEYIDKKHPTRGELIKHIILKHSDRKKYDPVKNRGHYGTNITHWKTNGHIRVINNRYHITKASKTEGKGMYQILDAERIRRLENQLNRVDYTENNKLKNQIFSLERKLIQEKNNNEIRNSARNSGLHLHPEQLNCILQMLYMEDVPFVLSYSSPEVILIVDSKIKITNNPSEDLNVYMPNASTPGGWQMQFTNPTGSDRLERLITALLIK